MGSSGIGYGGRYEEPHFMLSGFSVMSVDKLLKGIEKKVFGVPGKITVEEDGIKLTKTTYIPKGKDYRKALLEEKEYILGEIKYFTSKISEKDNFKKNLLEKDKDIHDLAYNTKRFTKQNRESANIFEDLYNYLSSFVNLK